MSEANVDIANARASAFDPPVDLVAISNINISNASLDLAASLVDIDAVTISEPVINAALQADGELNLTTLIREEGEPTTEATPSTPWQASLDTLTLESGTINFLDETAGFEAIVGLDTITASGIRNAPGTEIAISLNTSIDDGKVGFTGSHVFEDERLLQGTLEVNSLALAPFTAYLQQQFDGEITEGALSLTTEIKLGADGSVAAAGQLDINTFNLIDGREQLALLSFDALKLDRFEVTDDVIHLSNLTTSAPYLAFAINESGELNIQQLLKPADPAVQADESSGATQLSIARLGIADGKLDFKDHSLPLPFSALVTDLNGSMTTISTTSTEPASITLEGKVNDYGLSQINGELAVADFLTLTDIDVAFRNLTVANYSPYSAAFVGREIAEGKLDLKLNYRIEAQQLAGNHDIVIRELKLGDKVDHPDARSLPLDLAVSLLKNPDGVIDLELPVKGDVNDPEFELSDAIWQIFSNIITKAVTAPFRLLGGLIGIDSDELGVIEFEPGRHDLTPPELEKIAQLVSAMAQRPALNLVVSGAANELIDVPTLKTQQLRNEVIARLDDDYVLGEDMLDERVIDVLEDMLTERDELIDLTVLKAQHTSPTEEGGQAELDLFAYLGELRDQLLATTELPADALATLADSREAAIKAALEAVESFDATRIVAAEPVFDAEVKEQRIRAELTVQ